MVRIKNAALAGQKKVAVASTREKVAIAKVLKKVGFVEGCTVVAGKLETELKFDHKKPVLLDLKLVSRPGRRVYLKAADLGKRRGSSIFLLNSPKGVLVSKEAVKLNIGGEVIAEIW